MSKRKKKGGTHTHTTHYQKYKQIHSVASTIEVNIQKRWNQKQGTHCDVLFVLCIFFFCVCCHFKCACVISVLTDTYVLFWIPQQTIYTTCISHKICSDRLASARIIRSLSRCVLRTFASDHSDNIRFFYKKDSLSARINTKQHHKQMLL